MLSINSVSFSVNVDIDALEEKFPGITVEFAKHGLKQLLADNGAGETDKQKSADDKLARIMEVGFVMGSGGGGGKALTPFETECRKVVEEILVKAGMKRADAKKAATTPEATMKTVSKTPEVFEANWAKVVSKVNAVIAARQKNKIEVDVTL